MFIKKPTYLICESHGEYDDFTRTPLFTVDDYDLAVMIRDELEKELEDGRGEFYNLIEYYGFRCDYNHSFDIEDLVHLSID